MKYWVWLNTLSKITPKKRARIVNHFGDPEKVWHLSEGDLRALPFMNETAVQQIMDKGLRAETERHLERIYRNNISVVSMQDELYPAYLKSVYDPPIILYVKGTLKKDESFIGVVGSRKATSYGLCMAESISCELSRLGITVISGMARGIDSCAHKGALKAGGRTVAVLGCGLDIVYPLENKELMDNIINNGAVISEYPPGTEPLTYNFPARNRIISGASLGVVVIEAGEKSGSLITADFALEQGREVFAVPGNVNSINSRGTNKLIKDGAKIVTCMEDILEELKHFQIEGGSKHEHRNSGREMLFQGLDKDELKVAGQLDIEPLHIDMLSQKTGMSIQTINSILVMMELKGVVDQLPGKIFRLKE